MLRLDGQTEEALNLHQDPVARAETLLAIKRFAETAHPVVQAVQKDLTTGFESRQKVRRELDVGEEPLLVLHMSNLRPVLGTRTDRLPQS
jgi:hypothetical protein